ncbi:helix-turn-helix domain-containing protein [Halegenticoccus soli]|uniref:helix-turn-helix domain-containing protein n=1 Tax=Halegenticoccus soli TaxID=1985678 RepID=UPI000C6D3893|nr:helix-turn-helix domain-containing protein [Halegenticoccus soli]
MPRAKLDIALPDGIWIADVSTEFPETRFRVLAALPSEDTGVGLLEIDGPNLADVLRAMDRHEGVTELELLERASESVLVQFTTTEPLLLLSVRDAGMPLELPVEIRDGRATLEAVAPHAQLSMLKTQLEQFGMRFEVVYLYESADSERLLTERQREVLTAAVERGYYDTPRRCTLTELADGLGAAKSTVSETLHRAEERVIKRFARTLPQVAVDGESGEAPRGETRAGE